MNVTGAVGWARGRGTETVIEGVERLRMDLMGNWTLEADKVLVFLGQ